MKRKSGPKKQPHPRPADERAPRAQPIDRQGLSTADGFSYRQCGGGRQVFRKALGTY